ncbi:hypothetical protein J6590_003220 [Homalodisca vitripennis]|nr:hypothetical protein J6590_003220 [Homalodisca vitripennis]
MCDCYPRTCDLCSDLASCAVTTPGLDSKTKIKQLHYVAGRDVRYRKTHLGSNKPQKSSLNPFQPDDMINSEWPPDHCIILQNAT